MRSTTRRRRCACWSITATNWATPAPRPSTGYTACCWNCFPAQQDLASSRLAPFTDGHLFGTDQLVRDLLSRILHGGQVSLLVGLLAVVVSVIGIVLGASAGYFGGWIDSARDSAPPRADEKLLWQISLDPALTAPRGPLNQQVHFQPYTFQVLILTIRPRPEHWLPHTACMSTPLVAADPGLVATANPLRERVPAATAVD